MQKKILTNPILHDKVEVRTYIETQAHYKADELVKEALKDIHSWFFRKDNEEIALLYIRAANLYLIAKNNLLASMAFERASELYLSAKNYWAAIDALEKSVDAVKLVDGKRVKILIDKSIKIMQNLGLLDSVGELKQKIAINYEKEHRYSEAINFFKEAVESYKISDNHPAVRFCLIRIAALQIKKGQYLKAAKNYERVVFDLIKWKLPKKEILIYIVKSVLCWYGYNKADGDKALIRFKIAYLDLEGTSEWYFLKEIIENLDDKQKIRNLIKQNPWKVSLPLPF